MCLYLGLKNLQHQNQMKQFNINMSPSPNIAQFHKGRTQSINVHIDSALIQDIKTLYTADAPQSIPLCLIFQNKCTISKSN